jgi:hypothetical protein
MKPKQMNELPELPEHSIVINNSTLKQSIKLNFSKYTFENCYLNRFFRFDTLKK